MVLGNKYNDNLMGVKEGYSYAILSHSRRIGAHVWCENVMFYHHHILTDLKLRQPE